MSDLGGGAGKFRISISGTKRSVREDENLELREWRCVVERDFRL